MSSTPKVSILTPTYRHSEFIASTIRSVQRQTFQNWEMLVLDDGSDDGTAEVAEKLGDSRVRVFREAHRGIARLAETYNRGLGEARGELIAILEGDDLWRLDKLELQLADFEDSSVVLSAGRMEIRADGKLLPYIAPVELPEESELRNEPIGQSALAMMKPRVLTFTFPVTTIIRKSALDRIGGFLQNDYLPVVDYPTFLRLSFEGAWRFHDVILGTWRRHDASVTRSKFSDILNGAYHCASEFVSSFGTGLPATEETFRNLDRLWSDFQIERLLFIGRMQAADRQFKRASRAFVKALDFADGRNTRLMLKAAAASCRLGVSPEWSMRVGRKGDWRTELRTFGFDAPVRLEDDPSHFDRYPFKPNREAEV